MSRAAKYIRYGAFVWTIAMGLAFEATQATAAPRSARACVDESCDAACVARGFSGGVCNPGCHCF